MASSGKKGKKVKGKTIALNEFLGDAPKLPPPPTRKFNWAEEVDEDPRPVLQQYLPTAPRAARSSEVDESRIPKDGPYVAYISNLLYDVEERDISEFFQDLNIVNIRLPRDDRNGKLKGFGYVEFAERSHLLSALQMSETALKSRRIRIEVADHNNERDNRRGGMNRDRDRDSNYDPERTTGDWRSGPRSEAFSDRGPPPRRDFRDMDRDRDRDRDRDTGGDAGGNWRDAPRKPPMDDHDGRDTRDGRSSFGGPARRFTNREPSPPPVGRERPKLNLKPRTLPIENLSIQDKEASQESSETSTRSKPSIFGDAKPVETNARDRDATAGADTKNENGSSEARLARAPAPSPFGNAKPVDTSSREREVEEGSTKTSTVVKSNPFGGAKPVDTASRERELEEGKRSGKAAEEEAPAASRPAKPSAASIFGGAKPVDTATRERQIEERLAKERQSSIDPPKPRDEERSTSGDRRAEKPEKIEAAAPAENAWVKRAQRTEAPRDKETSRPRRDSPLQESSNDSRKELDDRSKDDEHSDRGSEPDRRDDRDRGRDSDRDSDHNRRDRRDARPADSDWRDTRNADSDRDRRDGDRRDVRDRRDARNADPDRRDDRRDNRTATPDRRDNDSDSYPDRNYTSRFDDHRDTNRGSYRDSDRDYNRKDDYRPRNDDRRRDDRYRDRRDGERDYRRGGDGREPRRDDYRRDGDSRRDGADYRRDADTRRDGGDKDYRRDFDKDRERRDHDSRDYRDRRETDRDRRDGDRGRDRKGPDGKFRDNNHEDKERGGSGSRAKDKPREPRPPREMPKASEGSAPNYVAPNKYSFLEEDTPLE